MNLHQSSKIYNKSKSFHFAIPALSKPTIIDKTIPAKGFFRLKRQGISLEIKI